MVETCACCRAPVVVPTESAPTRWLCARCFKAWEQSAAKAVANKKTVTEGHALTCFIKGKSCVHHSRFVGVLAQ